MTVVVALWLVFGAGMQCGICYGNDERPRGALEWADAALGVLVWPVHVYRWVRRSAP